jgi:hypothetical protein
MTTPIIVCSSNAGPYGSKNWLIELHLHMQCSFCPATHVQSSSIELATDISKEYSTSSQHDPEKKYLATFIVTLDEQQQVSFEEGQGNHPLQWRQLLRQPFHEFCLRVRKRIRHMGKVHKRMASRKAYDAAEVVVQGAGPTVKATINFAYQLNKDEYDGVLLCVEDCMQQIALTVERNVQLHLELPIYADPLADETTRRCPSTSRPTRILE